MSSHDRNRRLNLRVADGMIEVEFVAPSSQVRDLSTTGLYLEDPRTYRLGQTIELRLRLPGSDAVVVRGMVRRVDPGEGMAIEFIHVDAADRRRLKDFIARIQPEKISPAGDDIFG